MRLAALAAAGLATTFAVTGARAVPPPPPATVDPFATVCGLIEEAAAAHALPADFLTRLIARESRFRTDAVSPKGARGIAQFMPGTAAERGLDDPFDARQAIPAAAAFLAELHATFGNIGLAAAAYNGGPARVSGWLAGNRGLPAETRLYVRAITGRSAEEWAAEAGTAPVVVPPRTAGPPSPPAWATQLPGPPRMPPVTAGASTSVAPAADAAVGCRELARLLVTVGDGAGLVSRYEEEGVWAPWGVQLAGGFSRTLALAGYERAQRAHPSLLADRAPMVVRARMGGRGTRAFYRIRVPHETRREATAHCVALRKAGQACIVLKSP